MTQVITAVYRDQATGLAASAALKKHGFEDREVRTIVGAGDESVLASLVNRGLTQSEAAALANAVRNGASVVSVSAAFGQANLATWVLNGLKPADIRSAALDDGGPSRSASPFSDAFGWKTLSKGAAPFSAFFGLNPSVKSAPSGTKLLNRAPAPFSTSLGLKTLARNPAPFSSLFKLPLLSKSKRARA
jgi:hypothetical protein